MEITKKEKNIQEVYQKAIEWIENNTIDGQAIICNSDKKRGYPEVTGYYIPTLIRWGYRELAVSYAKWLCSIQKSNGSWHDVDDRDPYVFDTAQILKGLLAVRNIYPQVDRCIFKGCEWILDNMQESGRLTTPSMAEWGNRRICSELIHIYCLSPLVQAAEILGQPHYKEAAYKILNYYKNNHYEEIMNFGLLSHFYAYVMEALLDMGEEDMAMEAMEKVAALQKDSGEIPAYHNVDWVCSTGIFQFALVWYRLGNIERGNKAFKYACKLQNESGGWYGSYLSGENFQESNDYFPHSEISWAGKFFLDALYYKSIAEFNLQADSFLDRIQKDDGRYRIVENIVCEQRKQQNSFLKILDAGCGKGRYLKNLIVDHPGEKYYAVDLSERVMDYIDEDKIIKTQGALTNINYPDGYFDIVYTCEALEHGIDIRNAVKEMSRITRDGGTIVIIDKNKDALGRMKIDEWEIWFYADELKSIMTEHCSSVKVVEKIEYEQKKNDNLFIAWIGTVDKGK